MSTTTNTCLINSRSSINFVNGTISYTSPNVFSNLPLLKGRTLIDKDNNVMMIIDMNGNVNIYPITTNHTFVDKEHNEIVVFNSNGEVIVYPQVIQNNPLATTVQTRQPDNTLNLLSDCVDPKTNIIRDKINRFNQLKSKGIKYKTNPVTDEELEFRRLYQAIKYHEKDMMIQTHLVSLK